MAPTRRQVMTGLALLPVLSLLGCADPSALSEAWMELPAGERDAPVPLTGLVPYAPRPGEETGWADTAPLCSMEYVELGVAEVARADGFDWSELERWLDSVAVRGHRTIVRFYLDSPGLPSGIPAYLLAAGLDQSRRYNDWGNAGLSVSPDYADPRIEELLLDFIRSFGELFDGDERIAIVQHGLLGFWGEGHTYPYNGEVSDENPAGLDWSPSPELRDRLDLAWGAALPGTWHQARYPSAVAASAGAGFHDDSFGHETSGDEAWMFARQLADSGTQEVWRSAPIGAEVWPALSGCALSAPSTCEGLERPAVSLLEMAQEFHMSWVLADDWFTQPMPASGRAALAQLAVGLGAAPRPARVRIEGPTEGRMLTVVIEFRNDGSAPPYWRQWVLQARVVDGGTVRADGYSDGIDWLKLTPEQSLTVKVKLTIDQSSWPGPGTVQARVVDPMAGQPVRLGDAGWPAQDVGWSNLGRIS